MKKQNLSCVNILKPAAYNPRKITKKQFDVLGDSMRCFGDLSGIVRNLTTDNLVGGHQRIRHFDPNWEIQINKRFVTPDIVGTVAYGYIKTPFGLWNYREVRWTEAHEKSANIAANAHGGEFDMELLKTMVCDESLINDLKSIGEDIDILGLSNADLRDLIPNEIEQDEVSEAPVRPITKPGDLWLLGDHRLLCGDSTDADAAERLMGKDRATVVFTDPPYGVSIGKKNAMLKTFRKSGSSLDDLYMDDMKPAELGDMLLKAFTLWRRFMADDCSVFVCSPQGGGLGMMMMMMKDAGLEVRHILNWIKNSPTFSMGRLDYDYQHEPILFTWTKTHKRIKAGQFQTSLWTVDKPRACKEHPTMKPVELPTCAILNHSESKDIVVDIFLGSGTTLIAAEQTGRRCYGTEISPAYCDVIVKRWENFTGKKAILAEGKK
jgi:DNA modification methylase